MRPLVAGLAPLAIVLAACLSTRADVVINEIHYQPSGIPEIPAREFIELYNTSPSPVSLSGWKFTKGVTFTFPAGATIPAYGYLVVAANVATFQSTYPGVTNVLGNWSGSLSNTSEEIELENAFGEIQDDVTYADSGDWAQRVRETIYGGWDWRSLANGGGRTLELRNPTLDNNCGQNWGDSNGSGGSPGTVNSIASANIAPLITEVNHWPALPSSADKVTISCKLSDESAAGSLSATVFWRNASGVPFQSAPMTGDGIGNFSAELPTQPHLRVVEFYVQGSDGLNSRTWPAPTSEGQNANCQYLVTNEAFNSIDSYYFLVLTPTENSAFGTVPSNSDRQFNQTLIVRRGGETTVRYRGSMRIRGNSSRSYQFKPLRISLPRDNPLDGVTLFNLNPKSSYLQHLGFRMFQAAGLRSSDTIPVELRRNGVESTTSAGNTPDYGKWARVEDESGELIDNHWPEASGGNLYKKRRPDRYWRNTGWVIPTNPESPMDGWSKQNNSGANDWSDLTNFFARVQSVTAPHFPGSPPNDSAGSTGSPLFGNGNWNNTPLSATEMTSLETAADLDQWARWFAVMTILQDLETNISNGDDDDYGVYFAPFPGGQRRAQFVAHDLDTILGFGDTTGSANGRGLYDMTETNSVFRPLLPLIGTSAVAGNSAFRTKYLNAIRELYGSVFNASTVGNPNPPFYAFVDQHLGGWVPTARIAAIKNFAATRQSYLLGLIGSNPIAPTPPTSSSSVTRAHGSLMISEVLANSTASATPDRVEIYNSGGSPIDVGGYSVSNDPTLPQKFVFPAGTTLAPGTHLVLEADGTSGIGHLPFTLPDGGGALYLYASPAQGGTLIDSIIFGCQPANYTIGRTGPALDAWTLCTPTLGSTNAAVSSLALLTSVRINEWLGNVDYQFDSDFIELYNSAGQPVAIGGMSVTDDSINYPQLTVFPALSFIGPNAFLRLNAVGSDATPGDVTELPFRIDGSFGSVALIGQNGAIADRVDIVGQAADTSSGRSPNGDATIVRFGLPATIATPGAANAIPPAHVLALMNDLRVTEILYRPDNIEYIELQNIGTSTLDLSGVRFTRGITYQFESGATLAPGAFVVICRDRAAFQAQFGASVPLATGQYTGSLSNSGERVAFQLPTPWDAYILNFNYSASWFAEANNGAALSIIDQIDTYAGDWDQKRSWFPTPGFGGTPGMDSPPSITSSLTATAIAGDPFQYQITATKRPTGYAATGLPATLTLDPGTGLITGSLPNPGTFNIGISATNSGGTDTETLVLTVLASGPLAAFQWDPIASPQEAGQPFPATIRAVDNQGRTVLGFNGPVTLKVNADAEIGTGTSSWAYPFGSFYHDARTQSIYLASEIGGAARITALTLDVTTIPPQVLNNWTIRIKHTSLDSYSTNQWEGSQSGWVIVYQQAESITSTGLKTFVFSTPFDYDGVRNLMIDFSFNNTAYTSNGASRYTSTPSIRSLYYQADSDFGDPLLWAGTSSPTPNGIAQVPNIKLSKQGGGAVSPETSAPFVNGVLTQGLTISPAAAGVVINANDGAGHVGTSNSFDAVVSNPPAITSPSAATAVVGQSFSYQILATGFPTSFDATSLPSNLTINSTSGLISGVPSVAGSSSIGLSATNSVGTGSTNLALIIQSDADGDGMGDAWESSHGLNPASSADAGSDQDGDGETNLEEWIAGTLPDDPNSRFAITQQQRVPSGIEITWRSAIGKRYRVFTRTSLASGSWTDLTPTPIVAVGSTTTWLHVNGFTGSSRFYRVELVP